MFFWKLDEETIRCLINKREISAMGYNMKELSEDSNLMGEFLNHIVDDSQKYVEWNTENGIQSYVANSLPGEQFLLTISCTFVDESINRDLDEIKRMTEELTQTVTPERIEEIYNLTGEEKEQAFHDLTMDLQSVYNGNSNHEDSSDESQDSDEIDYSHSIEIEDADEEDHSEKKPVSSESKTNHKNKEKAAKPITPKNIVFHKFEDLVRFASVVEKRDHYLTKLYRMNEDYNLLVDFAKCENNTQSVAFMITAEEYGGICKELSFADHYLAEHGTLILQDDTLNVLQSFSL